MNEQDFGYLELFDCYKGVLTKAQREVCEAYFNLDLSLGEIADMRGTSRQYAFDTVARVKKELEKLESELCLSRTIRVSEKRREALEELLFLIEKKAPHLLSDAKKIAEEQDK